MYQNVLTFSDAYSDLYQLLTNNFHHLQFSSCLGQVSSSRATGRAIINFLVVFISIILYINSRNFCIYLIICFCFYNRQNSEHQFCSLVIFFALSLILKYWVDLKQELTNQKGLATSLKNLQSELSYVRSTLKIKQLQKLQNRGKKLRNNLEGELATIIYSMYFIWMHL